MKRSIIFLACIAFTACGGIKDVLPPSGMTTARQGEPQAHAVIPEDTQTQSSQGRRTEGALAVELKDSGDIIIGNEHAPRTLYETLDYDCEYCREFQWRYFDDLSRKYLETGDVRLVIRYFPLSPEGEKKAKGALCAAKQGAFLAVHAQLFIEPTLSAPATTRIAKAASLNEADWRTCIDSAFATDTLAAHIEMANAAGITRVPAWSVDGTAQEGLLEPAALLGE